MSLKIPSFIKLIFLLLTVVVLSGCMAQVAGEIEITAINPPRTPDDVPPDVPTNPNLVRVFSTDLQGSTSTPPQSASVRLIDHVVTKTTKETASTSASFQMISGVGLE